MLVLLLVPSSSADRFQNNASTICAVNSIVCLTKKSAAGPTGFLRDPNRVWRVADLAEAADVSLWHVSNVRRRFWIASSNTKPRPSRTMYCYPPLVVRAAGGFEPATEGGGLFLGIMPKAAYSDARAKRSRAMF